MKFSSCIFGLLLLTDGMLCAQEKWGYSVASIRLSADSGKIVQLLLVSNVKKLSALKCTSSTAVAMDNDYERCICKWFYDRIGQVKNGALSLIDRNLMVGDIEVYNNPPGAWQARLKTNIPPAPTIFLTKKKAARKRNDFLALARVNGSFVVQIE